MTACTVSCCVCSASTVRTAPARSANAFSSSRTAGSRRTSRRWRPGAVGQDRDQVRGLPVLVLRLAHALAVDRDQRPPVDPGHSRPQPRARDRGEDIGADLGECPPERGLVGCAAGRVQRREDVGPASAAHWPIVANDRDRYTRSASTFGEDHQPPNLAVIRPTAKPGALATPPPALREPSP
jgi:hypothetical protein